MNKRLLQVGAGGLFVLVSYLLLMELAPSPPLFWGFDKLQHLVVFACLTAVTLAAYTGRALAVLLGIACYGAVMEILQGYLTRTRQPSVLDWLADLIGVLCATWLYAWLLSFWRRRFARV